MHAQVVGGDFYEINPYTAFSPLQKKKKKALSHHTVNTGNQGGKKSAKTHCASGGGGTAAMNSEKVFQQESAEDPSCVSTQTQCRPAGVSGCCGRKEPLGERGRGRGKAGVAVRRSGGIFFFFIFFIFFFF